MIKKLFQTIKIFIKKLLYPVLYSYFGYQVYSFIQKLSGYKKERQRIFKSIGYYPNLKNPQSFNEKVLWKKIYDRNPLLPIISDKYKVRDYIRDVLGEKEAEKILVPLLYVTDNPESIPFNSLPEEYVIKPNYASGWYIFAEDIKNQRKYTNIEDGKTNILTDCKEARSEIINICKKWLSTPYGFNQHEWTYQKIKRKIVIEKLLRDSSGKIPDDYKFNIFNNKCRVIDFCCNRFTDLNYISYDQYWNLLPVTWDKPGIPIEKPKVLGEMLFIAEKLGAGFDFVRVDLYLLDTQIYFSELTNYPMSGGTTFEPVSYDFEMGSLWKITSKYWKRCNFIF